MDKKVIEASKRYARKNQLSLSAIIESYLKELSSRQKKMEDLPPITRKLAGSVKLPEDFDEKIMLTDEIAGKYL